MNCGGFLFHFSQSKKAPLDNNPNGFVTKAHGEVPIKYNDILAIELVKRRSKRVMYVTLFFGGILLIVSSFDSILSMIAFSLLAVLICIAGVVYLFTARHFVEFTTMRGTYRMAVDREDTEIEGIIFNIQKRI